MKAAPLVLSTLSLALLGGSPALAAPRSSVLAQFQPEEQVAINVFRQVSPAVVTIGNGRGSGSGSIVSAEGLVLTNNHVVRRSGGQVVVRTPDGNRFTGQVLATDPRNDLALVRINAQGRTFPTVRLAPAERIQVGQKVFAIGSPFGLSGTFTTGILSRIAPNGDLQTDAAINPGNSGGPLLNSRGELIGVNKAILSPGAGGNIGIGFATSAPRAQEFIRQFQARGSSVNSVAQQPSSPPPRLGVVVDAQTLVIQEIQPRSLASRIGLQPGDQLVAVDGRELNELDELLTLLDGRPQSMTLTVNRNQRLSTLRVPLR